MTEIVRYRCKQCGHHFETPILTEREHREATRDGRPVFAVHCPKSAKAVISGEFDTRRSRSTQSGRIEVCRWKWCRR